MKILYEKLYDFAVKKRRCDRMKQAMCTGTLYDVVNQHSKTLMSSAINNAGLKIPKWKEKCKLNI